MSGLKVRGAEALEGSFELRVEVEEGHAVGQPCPIAEGRPTAAPQTIALRVTGDLHVGGLMVLIAEKIGPARDWSDHALWWCQRGRWLLTPWRSLDAAGVGADARLLFAPRHRPLRLRLPNGRRLRLRLCFARSVAHAVAQACALLGLGPPEALSFLRPSEEEEEQWGEGRRGGPETAPDIDLSHMWPPRREGRGYGRGAGLRERGGPPPVPPPPPLPPEAVRALLAPWGGVRPTAAPQLPHSDPLTRSTRLHARWLDSSLSLWAQNVVEDSELLLRFRYPFELQLHPQRDARRLSLLFEQSRRALLSREILCSRQEALRFAAIQYHIDELGFSAEPEGSDDGDDVNTALSKLELKLGGQPEPPEALEESEVVLEEEIEISRPLRLFGGFRVVWAQLKGGTLSFGRSPPTPGEPLQHLSLSGCSVTPEEKKLCIELSAAAPEGKRAATLRCRDAPQFWRWLSGCRGAAQGLSQCPTAQSAPHSARAPPDPRLLLPPQHRRTIKAKEFAARVQSLLPPLAALSAGDARLRFLEAWSALPGCGTAHFRVRFRGSRRAELLAVGRHWLQRRELSGALTREWRLSALRHWDINWDSRQVTLVLAGEVAVGLRPLSASCRALHEALGGALCLGGGHDPLLLRRLLGDPPEP
ncbi:fermitin family homolog 3-like [Cuculus canorus]|uniref:fermitin family homolog 3-like n=1 Tax=Cuculus canorus TaxID=55661 RepID=UPI0023AA824A|nr:fermitin family homolog 3-like [Cuculus canorus]